MGDGINFNKMSFEQKVEQAKQNLSAQGKTAPTTADIVNEMVRLSGEAKTQDVDQLPDGFRIERTAQTRATMEVYRVPNPTILADVPEDVSKFMDFIIELLPMVDELPESIKNELVNILTEYVDALENNSDVTPLNPDDMPLVLYGGPVPNDLLRELLNALNKLTGVGITSDVLNQIIDTINDIISNPDKKDENIAKLLSLLQGANVPQEYIDGILTILKNSNGDCVTEVYGEPTPPDVDIDNTKRVLDFINKLNDMGLPQELVTDIIEELNKMSEDTKLIDILDNITEKINNYDLDDGKKAELMKAVADLLNEYNTEVITSICLYGEPGALPLDAFREIVKKLLPNPNNLTYEWKTALAGIVKNVIQILNGFDVADPSGIATMPSRRMGVDSITVDSIATFRKDHPENKYEIIGVYNLEGIQLPQDTSKKPIIVRFKEVADN